MPIPLGNFTIKRKLLSITLLFCLTLTGVIFYTIKALEQRDTDSIIVDIAGRQRMLTQKYTMEVLRELEIRQSMAAAQQLARAAANQIMADRAYYTEKVAAKLAHQESGISISSSHSQPNQIPLPATFVQEVSASLSEGAGYRYKLKSKWSINPSKGLSSDFDQRAWRALSVNMEKPYFEPAYEGKGAVLHYAQADIGHSGCIECHNQHPASPKRDFQLDGLMGVLTITAKITDDPEMAKLVLQDDSQSRAENTALLYEVSQLALRNGGTTFSDLEMTQPIVIPNTMSGEIAKQFSNAAKSWARLRAAVALIRQSEINGKAYYGALKEITTLSDQVLSEIHVGVGSLAKASSDRVHRMVSIEWLVLGVALIVSLMFSFVIGRSITRPIENLTDAAECIKNGEVVDLPKVKSRDEVGTLSLAFQTMLEHLEDSQTKLKGFAESLERQVFDRTESLNREISERRAAEAVLRESEARLQAIFDGIPDGIIFANNEHSILAANGGMEKTFGYSVEELIGVKTSTLYEDEEQYQKQISQIKATAKLDRLKPYQTRYRHKSGDTFIGETMSVGIKDDEGNAVGFIGLVRDITERQILEEQVRRSQKMDAVGQLTGGIAHDFNNILGIIMGNLDFLAQQLPNVERYRKRIDTIDKAAKRAANLTRQLLGFSRKQPAQVSLTDLNRVLSDMDSLIARAITPEVELIEQFSDELWQTKVDAGDLQDAILNLVINARDAMPGGGRLVLETRNSKLDAQYCAMHPGAIPGDYVELSVNDSGEGIADHLKEQIFEPFFTTKPQGKGTGLGLAMVFGFAKRSKGYVSVYSEVGIGTTFRIYLPRAQKKGEAIQALSEELDHLPKGDEVILVVDDEEGLLQLARDSLQALGYQVLVARDGTEANEVLESNKVQLVFSDIVMPGGVSGFGLAETISQQYPETPVLLTSGYSEHTVEVSGKKPASTSLLGKPYTPAQLATAIRSILDRPGHSK